MYVVANILLMILFSLLGGLGFLLLAVSLLFFIAVLLGSILHACLILTSSLAYARDFFATLLDQHSVSNNKED